MTADEMPCRDLHQFWAFQPALLNGIVAARGEIAAAGQVACIGDLAPQENASHPETGVRLGHCGKQSFRIGVHRMTKQLLGLRHLQGVTLAAEEDKTLNPEPPPTTTKS